MKELKINLDEAKLEKIEKYLQEGRFKTIDDFFNQAAKLLLYAEDKKEEFSKIISENTSTENS